MSWLDEAVSRRRLAQQNGAPTTEDDKTDPATLLLHQQQQVEAFDPLLQRLLGEYGEFAFPKSLLQKRFLVRLERPGKNAEKSWTWHWHLYSLIKHVPSIEVHPTFSSTGTITGFMLQKGTRRIEVPSREEADLKEGLVSLHMD